MCCSLLLRTIAPKVKSKVDKMMKRKNVQFPVLRRNDPLEQYIMNMSEEDPLTLDVIDAEGNHKTVLTAPDDGSLQVLYTDSHIIFI